MNFKLNKSELNFKVYTVASKPITPGANNDIAIITSVPMSHWIMSHTVPSGRPRSDGDVWIQYSVKGNTFNALKNNYMMIATIAAWQYVDGAWGEVEAVSCQNGEWVDWALVLISEKWIAKAIAGNSNQLNDPIRQAPNISLSDSEMTIVLDTSGTTNYRIGSAFYEELISFKNRNTITVDYSLSLPKDVQYSGGFVRMKVAKTMANGYEELATTDDLEIGNNKTAELSVSGLSDVDAYVAFELYTGRTKATFVVKDIRVS